MTQEKQRPSSSRPHRRGRLLPASMLVLLLIAGSTFWLYRRSLLVNFTDPEGPRYSGDHGPQEWPFEGQFRVVTWNIRFGEEIDTAIEELRRVEALRDADVLLLQEMDELGVEQIAKALRYNYVYYPASIHRHGRAFGNAVLSKWPIQESAKIILPHASPTNEQRRIAVSALLTVGDEQIVAYSVHTETPVLSGAKRDEQVVSLGQAIAEEENACIVVGGDFNTIAPGSVQALTEQMRAIGLSPATDDPQPTARRAFLAFTLDHIFVRGLTPLATGTWPETAASDHFPVWAVLGSCEQQ